jgi:hypothetical protein
MKTKRRMLQGLRLLAFVLLVSGCAGPIQRGVPEEAVSLATPVPQGYVLHQLRPDLGLVIPALPQQWEVRQDASQDMIEHQAEHEMESAQRTGQPITHEEALRKAEQHYAKSEDLHILNTQSDAHLLFSFHPLSENQRGPDAEAVAYSALNAAYGVTDEGWTKHSEDHHRADVKGARHAQYFEIEYSKNDERQLFTGIVGYAQPYWFWFYAYDHFNDPADRALLKRVLQTFEVRTVHEE